MINILNLNKNLFYAVCVIFSILTLASIISILLKKFNPDKEYIELRQRVRTWWLMAGMFTLAIILSKKISLIFFTFMSFLALKEYLSLVPTRRADRRVLFWAYISIPFQYLWVSMEWYGMFIIFIPVYVFLFLPMRMVLIGETSGFLHAAGTLHWGLMITVFNLSHAAYLLALPAVGNPNGGGGALVLFLVLLTEINDVSQYIWGKLFGKNKVIPRVSPNKTKAGLIGGLLTTTLLAMILSKFLTPLVFPYSIGAGLIIGLSGFIGDVVISALKRDLGVKDSGSILPGHGGILDRIDSLSYTAPLFFHYIYYLYY
ncbi:MAG: phosphatidate cytidylyltransferase [Ignavibacteriae bacterium]|nr:phosphatidate cytidylyltransferase [Ignavibacteriota bacterium]